eukprot:Seg6971.2 transcript_id=Seg6971.2/GoldUCD/mRNA.D3Y31 product="hypothetical protein" protein_id=Seg6971.2/GoldUCD/D3Y31
MNYPSGTKSIKIQSDDMRSVIASLAKGNTAAAIKKLAQSKELGPCLLKWIENTALDEASRMASSKNPSVLLKTGCDDLLKLKNDDIVNEFKERAPLSFLVLYANAVSRRRKKRILEGTSVDSSLKGLSMTIAVLMRMRCPMMSALSYKVSFILHHSGAKKMVGTTNSNTHSTKN